MHPLVTKTKIMSGRTAPAGNKLVNNNLQECHINDGGTQVLLKFSNNLAEVQACWQSFETTSWHSSFQTFNWVQAWLDVETKNRNLQPLIIRAYQADKLVFIMPLVIEQKHGFKQMSWMANELNDYNMPLALAEFITSASPQLMKKIWQNIGLNQADVDLYSVSRQPQYWKKLRNPFIIEPSFQSSCSTHLMSLRKNWAELYDEMRGKKTQKRLKQKLNKLKNIGQVSFRSPKKQIEKQELLEVIYAWKIDQLAQKGDRKPAVFTSLHTILETLVSQKNSKFVRLLGLYLDGKPIAGMVVFIDNKNFSFFNTAYKPDFVPNCSVGKILLVKSMELAARGGFENFDFMAGDEVYKSEWANQSIVLEDNFFGLSAKGKLYAHYKYLKLNLKKKLKNNQSAMVFLRRFNIIRRKVNDILGNIGQDKKIRK